MEFIGREDKSAPIAGASGEERGQAWRRALGAQVLLVPALLVGGWAELGRTAGDDGEVLAASALAVSLPLHVNARVDRWVMRFQTDQRAAFQRLLERQGAYDEIIRTELRERGMPQELVYVAMMESGLLPRAESAASAVGLWQFMSPTAQQYGLRIDEWVDERRDPVRSTVAALDYLSWLYARYGSWYLSAAAYNAGPATVDRALARYAEGQSGDEDLYWKVLEYLPRETRDYVPRLVAAVLVAQGAEREGFEVDSARPYRYDRVFVPGGTSLATLAWRMKIEPRVLRNLNPHLIQGVTPPDETYPIRVPVGLSSQVVALVGPRSRSRRAD